MWSQQQKDRRCTAYAVSKVPRRIRNCPNEHSQVSQILGTSPILNNAKRWLKDFLSKVDGFIKASKQEGLKKGSR